MLTYLSERALSVVENYFSYIVCYKHVIHLNDFTINLSMSKETTQIVKNHKEITQNREVNYKKLQHLFFVVVFMLVRENFVDVRPVHFSLVYCANPGH